MGEANQNSLIQGGVLRGTAGLRRQRQVQRLGMQREKSQVIPSNSYPSSMCTPFPCGLWVKKKRLMFNTTSPHSCFSDTSPAPATRLASPQPFPGAVPAQRHQPRGPSTAARQPQQKREQRGFWNRNLPLYVYFSFIFNTCSLRSIKRSDSTKCTDGP